MSVRDLAIIVVACATIIENMEQVAVKQGANLKKWIGHDIHMDEAIWKITSRSDSFER